jgi:hypothetical protein
MAGDALADEDGPDDAAANFIAKARWLMVISGVTTLIAIAAVLGVIGYRMSHLEGSVSAHPPDATPLEITALLPAGARVVAISAAADRIVVTVEVAGALEARVFDAHTLRQTGRLTFATEP